MSDMFFFTQKKKPITVKQAQAVLDARRSISQASGVHYLALDAITGVSSSSGSINSLTNQVYGGLVTVSQTGTNRPTLNATGNFNGGPSFDFASASSQFFALTNYGLKVCRNRPGVTIMAGHRPTNFSANQSLFWASLGTNTNNPRFHAGIVSSSGDRFVQFQGQDGGTYNYKQYPSPIAAANPVADIISIDAVGGKMYAYSGYNQFPVVNQFNGADTLSGLGMFSDTDSLSVRLGYDNQGAGYYNGRKTFFQLWAGFLTPEEIAQIMRLNVSTFWPTSTANRRQIVVTGDSNAFGLKTTAEANRMHNQIVANLTALSGGRSIDATVSALGGIPSFEQQWLMSNGLRYDVFGMPAPNLEKKVLVINQGGNDVLYGASSGEIVNNAIRNCRLAKDMGYDYVVHNNIGPNTNSTINAANVAANSALASSQADTVNGLGRYNDKLIDVYTAINANLGANLDPDGIHYGNTGMGVAGATIATGLQSITGWAL